MILHEPNVGIVFSHGVKLHMQAVGGRGQVVRGKYLVWAVSQKVCQSVVGY